MPFLPDPAITLDSEDFKHWEETINTLFEGHKLYEAENFYSPDVIIGKLRLGITGDDPYELTRGLQARRTPGLPPFRDAFEEQLWETFQAGLFIWPPKQLRLDPKKFKDFGKNRTKPDNGQ